LINTVRDTEFVMSDSIAYAIVFGPFALLAYAWWSLLIQPRNRRSPALTYVAFVLVSLNAAAAAGLFVISRIHPSTLPPWQDPINLRAGLLLLTVPTGMLVALFAAVYGGPRRLLAILELASLPLFLIGLGAAVSV
jgi:hypothetical protein